MTRIRTLVVAVLLAGSYGLVRGAMPAVQSGTWAPGASMIDARAGAASALLPSGAVLVTGGSTTTGVIGTVELLGPDGEFSTVASMNAARTEHAAVTLKDGRVLVVGGRGIDGALASAETYFAGSWMDIGDLTDSRWGHTATLLRDGRVLIAGGENSVGNVAAVEIFDPETNAFSVIGTLGLPRRGHAAAALRDGRAIIVGGFDGTNTLSSIEVFDPETATATNLPVLLSAPRAGLSATRLLDNKIFFFGGYDGSTDLSSGEVFDPVTGVIFATPFASVGRRDHAAFLLPNNNAVLIVGGVTAAGATSSAELYLPWLNQFWATGSMSQARQDATGLVLSTEAYGAPSTSDGLVVVAGGQGLASSEAYGFATIKTDLDDYSPGMTVYVTGAGWQSHENVVLGLREDPAEHESRTFEFQADENGRFGPVELFLVEPHHFGVRFFLTARGAASQAQTTFTDARQFTSTITPPTAMVSVPATYTVTVKNVSAPGDDPLACVGVAIPAGAGTVGGLSVVATDPPIPPGTPRTWTVSVVSGVIQAVRSSPAANEIDINGTVVITFTATATTAGTKEWTTTGSRQSNCSLGAGNAYAISGAQPTVDVAPASASLEVKKVVVNDNGGTALASDWTLAVSSTDGGTGTGSAPGSTTGTDYTLQVGKTYNVTESGGPSGYTESKSSSCTGLVPVAGGSYECTITNNDQPATLTVIKHVVNNNGGTKTASDFSLTVTGGNVQPSATFAGEESPGTTVTLDAGAYSVDEAAVSGYTKTLGADCSGTIANGATKTCTITNDDQAATLTVIKHVVNDNGGTKVAGDFSLTVTGSNVQPSATFAGAESPGTTVTLDAGTYNVDEAAVSGYTKTLSANCSGTIANGETKSCTIINDDQPGTLTVIKHVINDNGGTKVASNFSLTVTGGNVQPSATFPGAESPGTTVTLNAGSYSVDEVAVTGYMKTLGANCTGTIANGEAKTCTVTNDDQPGTLHVIKHVINDNGGTKVAGDFSLTVTGGNVLPSPTFPGAEAPGTTVTLNAGSYSVDEAIVSGYTKTLGTDCSGTIANGETKSCTITNDDQPGTLHVIKHVINDDGGTKVAGDFSLTVTGTNVQPSATFPGAEAPGTTVTLNAGSYSVDEVAASGYTKTLGADCSGAIANGETRTCTVTNNDQPGTLVVIKHVINDNGGTKAAGDFSLTVTGGNVQPSATFTGAEAPGTTVTLNAGNFSVDEVAVSGYTKTLSADCAGTIANGETKTCTITNDDQPGTLHVIKHVINDNGGAKVAGDFSLTVTGSNVQPSTTFPGAEAPGTTVTLNAGTYSVDETTVTGYTKSLSAGCSGAIANGETKTCTVTNDDQPGTLHVIKHVINDNGGTKLAGDFSLTVTATNVQPGASFAGAEAPGTTVTVNAGSYSVDEGTVSGYAKSLSADCVGVIGNGEAKTCTITNNDIQPKLIVIKHVINDHGGTALSSAFTMSVTGNNAAPANFAGAESPGTSVSLDAGAYNVSETGPAGYAQSSSIDCSGSIAIGETKTCTITNDDIQPKLTVIKAVINNNGGTLVAANFTMNVTGTDVSSPSFPGAAGPGGTVVGLDAGSYSVGETAVFGYAMSASADCSGTIAIGQVKTCTITNDDIQPKLYVIKHVVNNNGGVSTASSFTMSVTGPSASPASFSGSESPGTLVTLNAGSYSVTETPQPLYVRTDTGDCSGTIGIGEVKTCTITNNDLYDFRGFFNPVENLPTVNKVNAGRAIPLKWELRDHLGNYVLNLDTVESIQYLRVACSASEVVTAMPLDADDSGASGLRITDNQYHFNWKTEKGFANWCMELRVTLDDGTMHIAKFQFTK